MFRSLLGRKIEERGASINLANLRDPELIRLFGGGRASSAGVTVDEETALSTGTVIQAVRLISETMGMLPLHVNERVGSNREKRRASNHPLYSVLHHRPNPEMTRMEFVSRCVGQMILHGNAFAEIVRDGGGRVRSLWPIPDRLVEIKRDPETMELYYTVNVAGERKPLRASQMLHVPVFCTEGVRAKGLLHYGKDAIGAMVAAEQSTGDLYANGLQPSAILTHPKTLGDEGKKNVGESIMDRHGGLGNRGRILILEEDMKYTPMGITPKDAELIASRKFSVLEVARHTNIPPHMLMDLERATFSNIEEQGRQLTTYTFGPYCARIEQKMNNVLFDTPEADRFFVEFNVDALLRGNIVARYQAHQIAIQSGIMSRNEVRDLEGLPPFEGGDAMLVPLNMAEVGGDTVPALPGLTPGDTAPAKPGTAPAQDGDSETRERLRLVEFRAKAQSGIKERRRLQASFQKVIAKAAGQLVRREAREIKKFAEKHLKSTGTRGESRGSNEFLNAADAYYGDEYQKQLRELLAPVLMAYAEAVAGSVASERGAETVPDFTAFLASYMDTLVDARAKKRYQELIDFMKQPGAEGVASEITDLADTWVEEDPDEIGTRESVQLGAALAKSIFGALGVSAFVWITSPDGCPICEELNGQTTTTNPPLHKGCTCSIAPKE